MSQGQARRGGPESRTPALRVAGAGVVAKQAPEGLLVHGILQRLAGGELGDLGGRDVQRFTGGRVLAGAGGALAHLEGAEADQGDLVAGGQGFGDGFQGRVQGGRGHGTGDARLGGDAFDQFTLVHQCFQ